MGRASNSRGELGSQGNLFDTDDLGVKPKVASQRLSQKTLPDGMVIRPPNQTDSKAKLIAEYLSNFQRVTKGGLYIDGFAAPQKRDREDAWTARRVLEIEPKRIRCFWLCDLDPKGALQLQKLRDKHHNPKGQRRVNVINEDFNKAVKRILRSDRLTRAAAIFALLDQRTAECHWATVRALAARKGKHLIEQLYFFPSSWIHRSLRSSSTPARLKELDQWWGSPGWRELVELSQDEMARATAQRFIDELGYPFVNFHPIYQYKDGGKVAFHLIHASSHPEAPKLMSRAYLKVIGDMAGTTADTQAALPI